MAPYLERVKSFADVPITDAGIDTVAFLEACEGLVGLFDLLGSAAFTPVQTDLRGNITKVRTRYDAFPDESKTLEQLVAHEKAQKKNTATDGLLWLTRGLAFTCIALQKAQADQNAELAGAFSASYGETLKQFHNFVVKGVFSLAMKACPSRVTFFQKLAADPDGGAPVSDEKLNEELKNWLAALHNIVQKIGDFYKAGGYGTVL